MIPDCCHGVSFRLPVASFVHVQYAAFRMLPSIPQATWKLLYYFETVCVFISQIISWVFGILFGKYIWMYFCSSFCILGYNTVSVGEDRDTESAYYLNMETTVTLDALGLKINTCKEQIWPWNESEGVSGEHSRRRRLRVGFSTLSDTFPFSDPSQVDPHPILGPHPLSSTL